MCYDGCVCAHEHCLLSQARLITRVLGHSWLAAHTHLYTSYTSGSCLLCMRVCTYVSMIIVLKQISKWMVVCSLYLHDKRMWCVNDLKYTYKCVRFCWLCLRELRCNSYDCFPSRIGSSGFMTQRWPVQPTRSIVHSPKDCAPGISWLSYNMFEVSSPHLAKTIYEAMEKISNPWLLEVAMARAYPEGSDSYHERPPTSLLGWGTPQAVGLGHYEERRCSVGWLSGT